MWSFRIRMGANDLDHRTPDAGAARQEQATRRQDGRVAAVRRGKRCDQRKDAPSGGGMIAARSFQSVLHTLNFHLRDDFAVPHVAVRLWHRPEGSDELPEFADVSQELQAFAETLTQPYCGSTSGFETSSWFGEASTACSLARLIAMRNMRRHDRHDRARQRGWRALLRRHGDDLPRASRGNGVGGAGARPELTTEQ
jgi:hypothetical protein